MSPIELVLSKLQNPVKTGKNGYKACCPAHDDKTPSLAITEANDGTVLLKCWSGCSTDAVVDALGISLSDLFPESNHKSRSDEKSKQTFPTAAAALDQLEQWLGKSSATWAYHDQHETAIGLIVRWNKPNGKDIRPISKNGNGWYLGGMPEPRPLYCLPDVISTRGRVYVVEGEKAADAVRSIGLTATTSPHGANSASKADWSPLADKDVVLTPDNDESGEKYIRDVAACLDKLVPKPSVTVLRLPNLEKSEDAFDWINRRDGADSETIRDEFERLADAAGPFAGFAGSPHEENQKKNEWSDPVNLPGDLPPVDDFEYDLLPDAFRARVQDIATRMSCPPDFSAVAIVTAAAAVIGRSVTIRPKSYDDWTVVPNLWSCCVGRPGLMKTSAITQGIHPLRVLANDENERHEKSSAEFRANQELAALKAKRKRKDIAAAVDSGEMSDEDLRKQLIDAQSSDEADAPPVRRYLINDATYESVADMLTESPNGFLQFRDELAGWWASLGRDGQENARSFWLECWNGDGDFYIDRIGRGRVYVPSNTVSVLGATQPGKLRSYLAGAIRGDSSDDGMIQRHQLLVWPNASKEWKPVNQWPDNEAKKSVIEVFRRLNCLSSDEMMARRDDGDHLAYLRFDPRAQEEFDEWLFNLETHLRSDRDPPHLESHFSKYRSLVPSLALIFHLVDGMVGPVGIVSVRRAIKWASYLESHARRAYGDANGAKMDAARRLLKKLIEGALPNKFSLRDVYNNGWTGLSTKEEALAAVEVLDDFGWIRVSKIRTGGRPTLICECHPKISILSSQGTCKTSKSPVAPPFAGFAGSSDREIEDLSIFSGDGSECIDFDQVAQALGGRPA